MSSMYLRIVQHVIQVELVVQLQSFKYWLPVSAISARARIQNHNIYLYTGVVLNYMFPITVYKGKWFRQVSINSISVAKSVFIKNEIILFLTSDNGLTVHLRATSCHLTIITRNRLSSTTMRVF